MGAPVYSYGVMLGASFVVGWFLVLWLAERDGIERREAARLFLATALAALVVSRVLYAATNPSAIASLLDIFDFTKPGLVAYGGFLGGFAGSWAWCRFRGIPFLTWADCAVAALGTGLALGRTGCFLNGCDFGKPSDAPFAVRFPKGSPAFVEQLRAGLIPPEASSSLPVHPTQLYEVLIGLGLFALVMAIRNRRTRAGEALVAFTAGYAICRFFVEMVRADADRGGLGLLSTSQLIAVVTFLLAASLGLGLRRSRA